MINNKQQAFSTIEQRKRDLLGYSRHRINSEDFHTWAASKWVMYAACTIRNQQLLMEVNVNGIYRVTLGGRTDIPLYVGPSLADAINTYNEELS